MRTFIIYSFLIALTAASLLAQDNFSMILEEIEKNNTTLEVLRQQADAEKIGSKTGIYLENPEIGFHYLWGNPAEFGQRTDFSVMQSFDFPTAYQYKRNIADLRVGQADLSYQLERLNILYEARLFCIDLVYYSALLNESDTRVKNAKSIAEAVAKMYELGKAGVLEKNKAQLSYANALSDHSFIRSETNHVKAELQRLNGGIELGVEADHFPPIMLPEDFESWFRGIEENNPILMFMEKQVEISENEERLTRAMSFPKFSAGYMSEMVEGDGYHGLAVGMSIPLWENKNTVKAARARAVAGTAMIKDSQIQLYTILKAQYERAMELKNVADAYSESLMSTSNLELLKKAYDMGEISLIEYMIEIQFYYDTLVKALDTRREMYKAVAELEKWGF